MGFHNDVDKDMVVVTARRPDKANRLTHAALE